MNGESFHTRLYIAAPLHKVWKALVEPEIVSRYYLAPLLILEPQVGGKIVYGLEGRPLITGTVCCFLERERLEHTFAFAFPDGDKGADTKVSYTLEAVGPEITLLELEHSGFETEECGYYADIAGGWPSILSSLKTFLETGHPIVWPRS